MPLPQIPGPRSRPRLRLPLAAAALLLASCGGEPGREEQASAPPPAPAETAATAAREVLPPPRVDPADTTWRAYSFDEVRGYPLSMETVRRWAAAERGRAALFRQDPALRMRTDMRVRESFSPNAMNTAFLMAGVEEPRVAEAVGRAGISRRDWMLVTAKSPAIGMVLSTREARARNPALNARLDQQWPGVRTFVEANEAELVSLLERVRAEWRAAGGAPAA